MKVMIIGGECWTVLTFRESLIRAMIAAGHDVTVCALNPDKKSVATIKSWGAKFVPSPLDRRGINPLKNWQALGALTKIIKQAAPDIVFCYFAKPVIFGLLAARRAETGKRYAMIEGLGYAFSSGGGLKRRLVATALKVLYKKALKAADHVFFLNPDDRDFFLHKKLIATQEQSTLLPGIGVELDKFAPAPPVTDPPTFTLICRIIRHKGVIEFCKAAQIVKTGYPDARFLLVGPLDDNPAALDEDDLKPWTSAGIVTYRGAVDDVRPVLEETSVFVLPSYYREGLPRSIMEAMAMGRPVITTDMPGCRETVAQGRNGYLIIPQDEDILAQAMIRFIDNPRLIAEMGKASRDIAAEKFDIRVINDTILERMELAVTSQ